MVKLTTLTGQMIYLNWDSVAYFLTDETNPTRTRIVTSSGASITVMEKLEQVVVIGRNT